jgi:hypothetical protein
VIDTIRSVGERTKDEGERRANGDRRTKIGYVKQHDQPACAWYFLIKSRNLAWPKASSGGGDLGAGEAREADEGPEFASMTSPTTNFDGTEEPNTR